jgi:hypothetical protein
MTQTNILTAGIDTSKAKLDVAVHDRTERWQVANTLDVCEGSAGLEIGAVLGANVCGPLALAIEESQRLSRYAASEGPGAVQASLPSRLSTRLRGRASI